MGRLLTTALITAALLLGASGCAESAVSELPADAVIVDVRTPGEFDAGHLEGALNIDLSSPTFAAEIGDIDRAATVALYCRSGNRSAQAAVQLAALGFTDVMDLGGMDAAARSAGRAIVTD